MIRSLLKQLVRVGKCALLGHQASPVRCYVPEKGKDTVRVTIMLCLRCGARE